MPSEIENITSVKKKKKEQDAMKKEHNIRGLRMLKYGGTWVAH